MAKQRRVFTAEFKAKVALEAIRGIKTSSELASEYSVHPVQISAWKKQALEGMNDIFADKRKKDAEDEEAIRANLYQQIGQLQVELDWMKKNLGSCAAERRALIDGAEPNLSIVRQCQLAGVARSSFYYRAVEGSDKDAHIRRRIDQIYTDNPAYGSPRITAALHREGIGVNHKRVERLMRLMGLQAIYPRKRKKAPTPGHKIYPYLLRDLKIERVNQVWSTDITYVPTERGFVYLVAVLDWFSRYVLSWSVSTTMEVDFCLHALEQALRLGTPEIFNTDQGSQFTSEVFTGRVLRSGAAMSMDGRGRAYDNIFIERLWRTVKYENVYPLGYAGARDAEIGLNAYLRYYDEVRLHSALGYRPPVEVYAAGGGCVPG